MGVASAHESTHGVRDDHSVAFYADEGSLRDSVEGYIRDGLEAREPVIVIASLDRCAAFRRTLAGANVDIEAAMHARELSFVDANETLSRVLVDGVPNANRFHDVIGELLAGLRRAPRFRAYGEMVDILCREGRGEAAVILERLWNDVAHRHRFSLFCAYAIDSVADDADLHARICEAHSSSRALTSANETHDHLRVIADLTRRAKTLDAQLERSKQGAAFRLLVEGVKDYAIFMLDPQGFIKTWNVGAERLNGYTADEIIGQHFSRFYPHEDVTSGKCEHELVVAAKEGRFEEEGWRVRKDGARFWASVTITALFDSSGAHVGFAKVTRDLTLRREAEEQYLRLAQEREANRAKDELLATISHELRTPLNAIMGWAKLLAERDNDAYATKALGTIIRNAEAQTRLVEDMLDMARIRSGKLRLDTRPVDFATVVYDAIDVVRPSADAKGLRIELEGFDRAIPMVVDPARIQQVLWNLLSNAVKFTEAGAITVSVSREGTGPLRLSIRDSGAGIDPAFLPFVFERFRQANVVAGKRGGLGLGLAIVRHLVEAHGGNVSVESAGRGEGSTFTVSLPVREAAASAQPSTSDLSGQTTLANLSIIVVDDEPDSRELVATMLEERGANVTRAGSVAEARALIAENVPDAVVSDLGMPEEDGFALARSIRQLPWDAGGGVPLVAVTAYAGSRERRRAFEAGFNNHIPKPVDADELSSAIRTLVLM
jgi:PAS domain S-box-containing protein